MCTDSNVAVLFPSLPACLALLKATEGEQLVSASMLIGNLARKGINLCASVLRGRHAHMHTLTCTNAQSHTSSLCTHALAQILG